MRLLQMTALAACLLSAAGCHSAYVETTVTNDTGAPIQLLEVDYPSASFGTQNLAPAAAFHYRFKILGNGSTKLLYTDAARKDHTEPGPELREGQEGTLAIRIRPGKAEWSFAPRSRP